MTLNNNEKQLSALPTPVQKHFLHIIFHKDQLSNPMPKDWVSSILKKILSALNNNKNN